MRHDTLLPMPCRLQDYQDSKAAAAAPTPPPQLIEHEVQASDTLIGKQFVTAPPTDPTYPGLCHFVIPPPQTAGLCLRYRVTERDIKKFNHYPARNFR